MPEYSAPLPPTRATGDPGPATDVNTLTGAITELRASVPDTAAEVGAAATTHTHTASQISDSTATGRSLLTTTDAAAARSAIGAGTSSLELGTTASTAKAGDYQPTAANISDATATGRSLLTATDAAAARTTLDVAPVLVLAAGASVPGGTPAGAVIVRTA